MFSSLSTLYGRHGHATRLTALVALLVFAPWASATVYVTSNGSFPDDISSGCSAALTADLNCSSAVTKLRSGLYYPASTLAGLCTIACSAALAGYESDVTAACGAETYDSLTSEGYVPLYTVPQMLRYYYNYSCLADASSGQYCNVLAAEAIGILADQSNLDSIDGGGSLNCTDCDLKQLQFLAGAAYYNDDGIESMYSSLTSSCGATGYPLATSTLGFTGSTTATASSTSGTASSTCTGTTYTIQAGDTCESISKSQGVATMRLLIDNALPAYCAAFPTNGSLCIEHTCTTYTVQANDTCTDIASAHGLNYAQVLAWNPQFDLTCSNINKTVGLEICVSSPGPAYTPVASVSATATASSASTAAAVPTNAASGSVSSCGEWYEAVPGDYCNLIILRFGISLADFLVLNPEVNSNCTNLYAYESYCVEPVGDISDYPGAAGYESAVASFTTTPASLLPTATYIPALYSPPNVTYADGTRTDCVQYLNGSVYNALDLSNSSYVSQCALALVRYGITLDELATWNPSLEGTTLSNCSFVDGLSYCAAWSNDVPTTTYSTFPSLAVATTTVNCTQYTFADGVTCDDVLQDWNITLAYFYTLNPSVGADCSGMLQLTYYCVNTTDAVTVTSLPAASSATATSSSSVSPPGPTMSGIPATCDAYYVVQSGDSCASVEAAYDITDAEFHAWNPSVSDDCVTNFWTGEAYCVGVSSSGATSATTTTATTTTATPTSSSSSSRTATSTATTTSVTPPGPTMSGIPADCNAYYVVQSGDSCASVEAAYGITDAEFHAWNPAVSADCVTNFWTEEAYCVGVSSSGTTTTSSTKATTATATTTSVTPPGPTMTGTAANCNKYYVVQSGDSCSSVEAAYGITDSEFHTWNPAVSDDCVTNFWTGEAYCVGVSS